VNVVFVFLHKAILALCVGLALLCTLSRPVFTTLQELHEWQHAVASAGGAADASVDPTDAGQDLESVFHAPHCCVHAALLPPMLVFAPASRTHVPPQFIAAAPRASPLSRFLRPPIAV
jgi:hypothetical protein